jgi:hypothetical protein
MRRGLHLSAHLQPLAAVFQDGVKALVEKGYKKITPFFIPYAITNMGGACLLPHRDPRPCALPCLHSPAP